MQSADFFPDIPTKNYIQLLTERFYRHCQPGSHRPTPQQWEDCEREIGKRFPEDYKQVVSLFGIGAFGDSIWVSGPRAPREELELSEARLRADHDRYLAAWQGFSFHPDPSGLVMFGSLSVRMLICFQDLRNFTDTPSPLGAVPSDEGKICLIDDDESREVLEVGFAEFLYRIATNHPPMTGSISSRFHGIFFSDPSVPFFRESN